MSRVSDDLLGSMLAVGAYVDNHSTITDALLDLRDARRERDGAGDAIAMLTHDFKAMGIDVPLMFWPEKIAAIISERDEAEKDYEILSELFISERDEAEKDYEILSDLLKRRFPPNPDGSLPDYKIEDVLRDNQQAEARCAMLREALVKSADMLREASDHFYRLRRAWDRGDSRGDTAHALGDHCSNAKEDALKIVAATDASAWLAEHDARVRAEERERIAAYIERDNRLRPPRQMAAAIRALGDAPAGEK